MPITLTKTTVNFNQFSIYRQLDENPYSPTFGQMLYYMAVSYQLNTAEEVGDPISRHRSVQLTGAQQTQAVNMFTTITNRIKNVEGLP